MSYMELLTEIREAANKGKVEEINGKVGQLKIDLSSSRYPFSPIITSLLAKHQLIGFTPINLITKDLEFYDNYRSNLVEDIAGNTSEKQTNVATQTLRGELEEGRVRKMSPSSREK